jgi:lysosomal acid phosphatase
MPAIAARAFTTNTHTPQLARLKTGPLLKEILTRSVNKTIGKLSPNRAMWIYSAHDTTVANVLNTLGLFEMHNPPYRACIMIELHLIDQRPYISVFYKNTSAEPEAMYIPNCGQRCPLDKMFELYEAVLPVDWEQECQLSMLSMPYVDVDFDATLGE